MVKASLEFAGEAWKIIDVDGEFFSPCPTSSVNPVSASANATSPSTGVDLLLNSSPSEFATAQTNAAHAIWRTRKYVRDRVPALSLPLAGLDDVVEVFVNVESGSTNGRYISNCYGCNNNEPCLVFSPTYSGCVNTAYSTWVAHEYGHYLAHQMREIENNDNNKAFHEGWSDTLALLTYATDKWGEDLCLSACNTAVREPQAAATSFPVCSSDPYVRSMLLSALWLDLAESGLGLSSTRQLHVDWMLVAVPPNADEAPCSPTPRVQAADEHTLIEILTVDDDDGNLNNGTPNDEYICPIFSNRNITTGTCPDGAGRRCVADCDFSTGAGVLDVFDFLCFQARYAQGDPRACNCDTATGVGVCDAFGFLCFQRAFSEGCP